MKIIHCAAIGLAEHSIADYGLWATIFRKAAKPIYECTLPILGWPNDKNINRGSHVESFTGFLETCGARNVYMETSWQKLHIQTTGNKDF